MTTPRRVGLRRAALPVQGQLGARCHSREWRRRAAPGASQARRRGYDLKSSRCAPRRHPDPIRRRTCCAAPHAERGPSGGADGAEEGASPGASPPATGSSGRLTGRQTLSSRQPLSGRGSLTGRSLGASSMYGPGGMNSARPLSGTAKMKFHFFSFQIYGTTGLSGSVLGLHGK